MMKFKAIILLLLMFSLCACANFALQSANTQMTDTVSETTETESAGEPDVSNKASMGEQTLKQIDNGNGFYVRYSDGSFDTYYSGSIINWGPKQAYTYGVERSPSNMVIRCSQDKWNMDKMRFICDGKAQLVFKSKQDQHVDAGIYPVVEDGYAMYGESAEGRLETLLWTNESFIEQPDYVDTITRTPEMRNFATINGVKIGGEIIFSRTEGKKYVDLNEGEKYLIGEQQGTTLFESEYTVNRKNYLNTLDTSFYRDDYPGKIYPLELEATTEGYAIVDLEGLPPGDYIIIYSFWNDGRYAFVTHICIE